LEDKNMEKKKLEFYECRECGGTNFKIVRGTLERGDKPTVLVCADCGNAINT